MAIPDYQSLMLPLLRFASDGKEHSVGENKGVLDESRLVIPDDATLEAYTNLAAPLFLQIKNCHHQSKKLTQLRDWLLPMLMNGQVRVV